MQIDANIVLTLTVTYLCAPYFGLNRQTGGSIKIRSLGCHGIDVKFLIYTKIKRKNAIMLNVTHKNQTTINLIVFSKYENMMCTAIKSLIKLK